MKKYQYLALAVGISLLPIDNTYQATQAVTAPTEDEVQVAPMDAPFPEAVEVYRAISESIPADNPVRRNKFLAEIWRTKREDIISGMNSKSKEYSGDIIAVAKRLTVGDWDIEKPELEEDAKYAVQMYIQCQGVSFFSTTRRDYQGEIEKARKQFEAMLSEIKLPEDHELGVLLEHLERVDIGCPGCALTYDLIMDIIKRASSRLCENPRDVQGAGALHKLLGVIKGTFATGKRRSLFAHKISGLPKLATETARAMRTMSTQLRSEFTSKDIGSLLGKLDRSDDFPPFQKAKLREELNKIRGSHPEGIAAGELKTALLKIARDEGKIDQFIRSVRSDNEPTTITREIDERTTFEGKLAVYSGSGSTEPQPSDAGGERGELNEDEKGNVRRSMAFFKKLTTEKKE